ncbi:V-type ATP synthase subunit I [Oscillibacter hominis]|uniref:V-type ATP synthase subunit I n=1 Tax=Oscillibacter hominis TaxID=2763056 RepID=A0A7G9B7F3_9FIRM|nr:V-type ATP synthase subunit I [Oscillibacter hominis]QNL45484.1 V-type ATP synthase subunit I [Oscillibacter hominis]
MAIVKMKRLRVIALASQRQELLDRLLRLGCVEISEPGEKLADPQWAHLLSKSGSALMDTRSRIAGVNAALSAIRKYGKVSDGLFVKRSAIGESEFFDLRPAQLSDEVNGLLQTLGHLQGEEGRLIARRQSLTPWAELDLPLEREGTQWALFRLAVCPAGADPGEMRNQLSELAAELFEVSADKQQRYLLLVVHRSDEQKAMEILRPHGVSLTSFKGYTGTASENLAQIDRSLEENRRGQSETAEAIAAHKEDYAKLRIYADQLNVAAAKESSAERLMTDGTIVFFEGWAPADSISQLQSLFEEKGCAWEAEDPAPEEYPQVPVKLKNNLLTRPLNMVTEMYSLPAYDGVDPNPLMAPFFILFYGIMMADMGYGLLMMLASAVVLKKYRPKGTMSHFFGLLGLCGVSTFLMGAVTGGFFGDFLPQAAKIINPGTTFTALPSLFTPLDDTLMILVGSMCLGAVQIITGMAISFVEKLRRGEVMDAIWEEVTWWVVFAGIALAILGVTNLLLIAGIVMVLVGSGWNAKGFGKVTAVFGSLYNHVTGYFGDILSYSRLMALMLAGSVIAQVFNTLGAIPGNIVVFLIISLAGNALNFALNLLGCYVHDLRLQCLEYFGKFYKDGGKPFRPLEMNTKFVDIVKE